MTDEEAGYLARLTEMIKDLTPKLERAMIEISKSWAAVFVFKSEASKSSPYNDI